MTLAKSILAELHHESAVTKKMLERVPFDQLEWRPHGKSMDLLHLAQHIAYIPIWIQLIMESDEMDFAAYKYTPLVPETSEDLLNYYNNNMSKAEEILSAASDEELFKPWPVRRGDHLMFSLPKVAAIRNFTMNHLIHHRGQLSVYLRLLDIPVPGAYGPSADEA